jgi:hypothetical protein
MVGMDPKSEAARRCLERGGCKLRTEASIVSFEDLTDHLRTRLPDFNADSVHFVFLTGLRAAPATFASNSRMTETTALHGTALRHVWAVAQAARMLERECGRPVAQWTLLGNSPLPCEVAAVSNLFGPVLR